MSSFLSNFLRRLFAPAKSGIRSLNAQAALGPVRPPACSQFTLLFRHFLERFFNHETASPDGDARGRLLLLAVAAGLPGFLVALYLWPLYHPLRKPPGSLPGVWAPPYWQQVNHHFFFVVYSFAATGAVAIFEWDLFFPDLLDLNVLSPLPIPDRRLFLARIAAIATLLGGFLIEANLLAALALPIAVDPPGALRFLAGHLLAVLAGGLFSAAFVLALQSLLLSLVGERIFRRASLFLQASGIAACSLLLLLFPVISAAAPAALRSGSVYALCFPPFWFLGIFERLAEGPSALSIYSRLAQIGWLGTGAAVLLAMLAYPFAYRRKVRQLAIGRAPRHSASRLGRPLAGLMDRLIHALLARSPLRRAVFHLIGRTMTQVPRYRIYLALCGGVGIAAAAAAVLRVAAANATIRVRIAPEGIAAAVGIAAFWTIAGLRAALVSSGNSQPGWVFRLTQGRPPGLDSAVEQLSAAKVWALFWGLSVSVGACLALLFLAPAARSGWRAVAGQLFSAVGVCLLIADLLFLKVTVTPFAGEPAREQTGLAIALLKAFAFIPVAAWLPSVCEPWLERGAAHMAEAMLLLASVRLALEWYRREILREHCNLRSLEDGEEEFPLTLGLRG